MSYDTLRIKVGRRPITIVELDLDYCSNTYGTSPCTASVPTTGTQKCFNCYATCQDTANFVKTTKTYSFTEPNAFLPIGENAFPCIRSVDIAPTQLKPFGFSVSASVTVTLDDFPHHDRGIDPYVSTRAYNPNDQGSFFGKLKARNPYVINRVMRVKTGYLDDNRVFNGQTRTYFIDRIEGPDNNGTVKIIGKDILRFAEIQNSLAPKPATASLSSGIGTGPISWTVVPSGSGADYETNGRAIIDGELLLYTRSGDSFSSASRPLNSGLGVAHAAGSLVQECFAYNTNTRLVFKIKTLLVDFAGIDASYIPYSDWETECDAYIDDADVDGLVGEPESVKKLIEELLESYGCALWWDELDAKIKFKVMAATGSSTVTLNENDHILENSMTVKVLEKERISRVQISYSIPWTPGQMSPTLENCDRTLITIDTASEGTNQYGFKSFKGIVSRWMSPFTTLSTIQDVADRYLARYSKAPREVTFKLDAKDSTLRTGDIFSIQSRLLQSPDGSISPIKFMVTEFREVMVGSQYQYTALEMGS